MDPRCRACDAPETTPFFEIPSVPVHSNLLFASSEEALGQAMGRLALTVCDRCGFVQNAAHDADLIGYDESYEDAQGHSGRFRVFADELVADLVRRYDLRQRRILEIGSGQGAFLRQLCEYGENQGVGFDPAYRGPRRIPLDRGRMEIRAEPWGPEQAGIATDFVFLRHTLEHVPEPARFVASMARTLPADVPVYVEVPEAGRILHERAFWDVYYEHPSYFCEEALVGLFERHGFRVERVRVGFDGQYLMLEVRAPGPESAGPSAPGGTGAAGGAIAERARGFGRDVDTRLAAWRRDLEGWRRGGQRVVLWGAGSKAVGFLTALGTGDAVDAIVDINPAKQGAYQAGTGHAIVGPERLVDRPPGVVIVMNPIYRDEIGKSLGELGVSAEVRTL